MAQAPRLTKILKLPLSLIPRDAEVPILRGPLRGNRWIDVEGAELEVLHGASRALSEFHPKIFLEIHGTQLHSDCRAFLAEKGYSIEEKYGRLTATWRVAS